MNSSSEDDESEWQSFLWWAMICLVIGLVLGTIISIPV